MKNSIVGTTMAVVQLLLDPGHRTIVETFHTTTRAGAMTGVVAGNSSTASSRGEQGR